MSIIGYLVSIPVFCDSGFVILNSLKNALAARMKISTIAMSVALATGLYATHTFVPPTPGPIAAAGNLGLDASLGLVIVVGLVVAFVTAMAGMWWANRFDLDRAQGLDGAHAYSLHGTGFLTAVGIAGEAGLAAAKSQGHGGEGSNDQGRLAHNGISERDN